MKAEEIAAAEAIAHGLRFAPEAVRSLADVTPPAPREGQFMWPEVEEGSHFENTLGEMFTVVTLEAEQRGMWVVDGPVDFNSDIVRVRLVTGEMLHERPCGVVSYDARDIEWTTTTGTLPSSDDILSDIDDLLEEWESGEDAFRWKP